MKPMTLTELIAARRDIDAQLAELLKDPAKPEGAISVKDGGYKLTVTYKISRTVDSDKLTKEWSLLSKEAQDAFKWKADVSVSALRKLTPADAGKVAPFVTAKEASPSISIEAV